MEERIGAERFEVSRRAVPRVTRTFKVVVVADGEVLLDRADARATIDTLTRIDSMFDVSIYVWDPAAKAWRPLTVGEQRTLWSFRGR